MIIGEPVMVVGESKDGEDVAFVGKYAGEDEEPGMVLVSHDLPIDGITTNPMILPASCVKPLDVERVARLWTEE